MCTLGQSIIAYKINVGYIIQSLRAGDFVYTTIIIQLSLYNFLLTFMPIYTVKKGYKVIIS